MSVWLHLIFEVRNHNSEEFRMAKYVDGFVLAVGPVVQVAILKNF